MAVHMSARPARHMEGWNGHVCKNPAANTYCVGPFSYPGEMVAEKRDLKFEQANAGKCCTKLKGAIPPCIYSINAFGKEQITAFADPPAFFKDNTSRHLWDLLVAESKEQRAKFSALRSSLSAGRYDYHQRLQNAKDYFDQFDAVRSLIFYYSNYTPAYSRVSATRSSSSNAWSTASETTPASS